MTDAELLTRFESATLDPEQFHHEQHVRVAWMYLRDRSLLQALPPFTEGLKRFAASVGKPERYHETITWAFLIVVHERLVRGASRVSWDEFTRDNADLLEWPSPILRMYYSEETIKSDVARQAFVMPECDPQG